MSKIKVKLFWGADDKFVVDIVCGIRQTVVIQYMLVTKTLPYQVWELHL